MGHSWSHLTDEGLRPEATLGRWSRQAEPRQATGLPDFPGGWLPGARAFLSTGPPHSMLLIAPGEVASASGEENVGPPINLNKGVLKTTHHRWVVTLLVELLPCGVGLPAFPLLGLKLLLAPGCPRRLAPALGPAVPVRTEAWQGLGKTQLFLLKGGTGRGRGKGRARGLSV